MLRWDKMALSGFELYEPFRSEVPEGVNGWGAKAEPNVDWIRKLLACKARRIR